jgi:hypothetical protein
VIRTVDLVIAGAGTAVLAAATDSLQRGGRVLIVLGGDAEEWRCVRRALRKVRNRDDGQVTVITNAEVVCVDGVDGVEAVVVRYARTGRLCAVNTSAFLSCDGPTKQARIG